MCVCVRRLHELLNAFILIFIYICVQNTYNEYVLKREREREINAMLLYDIMRISHPNRPASFKFVDSDVWSCCRNAINTRDQKINKKTLTHSHTSRRNCLAYFTSNRMIYYVPTYRMTVECFLV